MPSPTVFTASLLLLAAAALAALLGLDLKRFLAGTPVLTSVSGVVAFRRAVARQMYGALGVLLLGGGGGAVAAAGFALRLAAWREIPALLVALAVFAASGVWCRLIEARAKAIPVVNDEIGRRRDDVIRVWTNKPLPTWRDGLAF